MFDKKIHKNIFFINQNFQPTLKTIIFKYLKAFPNTPLEWEDIYFSFLVTCPKIMEEFDESKGITFKTFLGLKCKYFTRDVIKKYSSNRFKVLNNSFALEENLERQSFFDANFMEDDHSNLLEDIKLTNLEKQFYELKYVKDLKFKQISKILGISLHRINKIHKDIQRKIKQEILKI